MEKKKLNDVRGWNIAGLETNYLESSLAPSIAIFCPSLCVT